MNKDRDPRTDPRVGDLLVRGKRSRRVVSVELTQITKQMTDLYYVTASGRREYCPRGFWLTWAEKATVKEYGE